MATKKHKRSDTPDDSLEGIRVKGMFRVHVEDPETGERMTTPVTRGMVKCQWKADWAMRWTALGIDYEMAGKDLIDSVKLSGKIAQAIGGTPPEGFNYELFLDDKGQKISKSKGNGLTIDEWLRYASPESLSLFMYREPKAAKRLYFDVIPRNVDDYYQFLDGFARQDAKQQLSNPVWHIHSGQPPKVDMPVTFQLLLTLVSSSNAENADTLWIDWAHRAHILRLARVRLGITGAAAVPSIGRILLFPLSLIYLLLYAATVHTRRFLRMQFLNVKP